jgi:7-cyano-7-deazaguanine synthase
MHKVYTLLSGGVDSTTTLAMAKDTFPEAEHEAVTIDYGQRHAREAECAHKQAELLGATHYILPIHGLMDGMLVDKPNNEAIPDVSYAELAPGISPTYVTFRNGLMLSVLAARAQGWVMAEQKNYREAVEIDLLHGSGADLGKAPESTIFVGIHADDGVNWAYPDCTPEFFGSMAAAIYIGTYHTVRVRAPLLHMTKPEVVEQGLKLGVDYANTWSCYKGESVHCGTCPTCRSRKEAFILNGAGDPTEYAA